MANIRAAIAAAVAQHEGAPSLTVADLGLDLGAGLTVADVGLAL